jgi:ABC-type multidrug transport system ATPase subunit
MDINIFSFCSEGAQPKKILSRISGVAHPGRVLGILGPSGAGKTTLLGLLSGRTESGLLDGRILYGGEAWSDSVTPHRLGYCPQHDEALVEALTVRQMLTYTAKMSCPESTAARGALVDTTLKKLGLLHVAESTIGSVFRKSLSGGEKRRVSVAAQLLKRPQILLLDEVTSGLDSFLAARLMADLASIARETGVTVVATIHQPNPETVASLDDLLVLARGEVLFWGPREDGWEVLKIERGVGNIADHFLTLASSSDDRGPPPRGERPLQDPQPSPSTSTGSQTFDTTWRRQFRALFGRNLATAIRDPLVFGVRAAMSMFMAVVIGALYFRIDNAYDSISDLISAYFFSILVTTFVSLTALPPAMTDRVILTHEIRSRYYKLSAYVAASLALRFLVVIVVVTCFSTVVFPLIGVGGWAEFFFFTALLIITNVFAEVLMLILGALVPVAVIGIAVGVSIYGFFMLMSGTFISPHRMRIWMRWLSFLSYYRYTIEGLMLNSFERMSFKCPVMLKPLIGDQAFEGCVFSGQEVLEQRFDSKSAFFTPGRHAAAGIIGGLIVVAVISWYLILKKKLSKRFKTVPAKDVILSSHI